MSTLETLTQRNREFADHHFDADLSMMPSLRTMVISCADPRVDPVHILGLHPGEVAVIRNVGGRITPDTLQNLMLLQRVGRAIGGRPDAAFDLVVLHHTDCGIRHLGDNPEMLAHYFGIGEEELPEKAVGDPYVAVQVDLAFLKAHGPLPPFWNVTGMVYDVTTGHVDIITP